MVDILALGSTMFNGSVNDDYLIAICEQYIRFRHCFTQSNYVIMQMLNNILKYTIVEYFYSYELLNEIGIIKMFAYMFKRNSKLTVSNIPINKLSIAYE